MRYWGFGQKHKEILNRLPLAFAIVFALAVILILSGRSYPFTFEGELNPDELDKGEIVEGSQAVVNPFLGIAKMMLLNPDKNAEIRRVRISVHLPTNTILNYDYFRDGYVFDYYYELDRDHYFRKHYTWAELTVCRACHETEIRETYRKFPPPAPPLPPGERL